MVDAVAVKHLRDAGYAADIIHADFNAVTSPVVSVDLAVGLPPEHYGVLNERFAAYFKREKPVRFSYKGRQIMLSINRVLAFPQAYAAVALDSSIIGYSRLFLIDIGGYTTDVLLLRNGKPDLQYCRSLECGIITIRF